MIRKHGTQRDNQQWMLDPALNMRGLMTRGARIPRSLAFALLRCGCASAVVFISACIPRAEQFPPHLTQQTAPERAPNTDTQSQGFDKFLKSCGEGRINEVRAALDADSSLLTMRGKFGLTCLHMAANPRYDDSLSVFLEDPPSVVSLLLERGVDVNIQSGGGLTPLHMAATNPPFERFANLLVNGRSFGQVLAAFQMRTIQLLIDAKADVNSQDSRGATPLHYASNRGHIDMVRTLLDNGADPALTTKDGKTARELAEQGGQKKVVELLK